MFSFLQYQFTTILNKVHEYIVNIAWKKEGEQRIQVEPQEGKILLHVQIQ